MFNLIYGDPHEKRNSYPLATMHYFVSYFNISVLSATIVKKNLRNNLGLRAVTALSVIHHPDKMVRKASDVASGS